MARPRTPTVLLKLAGTYRADRQGGRTDEQLSIASGEPVKPRDMNTDAKWWWKQTVESMPPGVFGRCDSALLHQAVDWWCQYKQARERGDDVAMARATDRYMALSSKLALGPVERARLQLADDQQASEIVSRDRG